MTRGATILGWILAVYLFMMGLAVITSGRFIGKKGAVIMAGPAAQVAGAVFFLLGSYLL